MVTEERTDNLSIFKKFFTACGVFLVLVFILEICAGRFLRETAIPEDAWTITLNGEEINSAPGRRLLSPMNRGDVLVCSAVISDCDFSYPALVFEMNRSHILVTNAGNELYSSENKQNTNPSDALLNQIALNNVDFSKPVNIEITAEENNCIYAVPNISLVEHKNGFSSFIKARSITFVISLFLFFLGVIGTVICAASRLLSKKLMPLITISQFTFWASLCTFCHLGYILIFFPNKTAASVLELLSFYLAVYFIGLIVYPKFLLTKKKLRLFKRISYGYLIYCFISLLLPLFNWLSVMDTFYFTMIPLLASLAITIFMCLKYWIKQPDLRSFPVAGFLVLVVFTLTEVLRIMLNSAGISLFGTPEMIILSFGILIFTASSLIDYFNWYKQSTIQETVEESWKRFKQPNSKAGISGFQKTMALLQELQDSSSEYTIATISIDNIEELKMSPIPFFTLEDNFARLLHTVFSSYGITGNLGNGKFLVALPDIPEGKMIQLLRVFKELVRRDNENHPDGIIKFSSGYAHSTDSDEHEITKICQLANNSRIVEESKLLQ